MTAEMYHKNNDRLMPKKEGKMKTLLTAKVMEMTIKARCVMGAAINAGTLLSADVQGLKPIFNTVVIGFGVVIALKGIATLSEGQGEQISAAKSQGYGYIGGAVVVIIAGIAVIEYLFKSVV